MYSEGAPDFGIVPTSAHYPRVAVHANAIDMILSGQYLRPSARVQGWLKMILTLFLGVACGISVRYLAPIRGGISMLGLMVIYPVLGFQLFASFDFVLPLVRPEFAVLGTFAGNAAYYFLVERRRRRRIGDYLMGHVSKNVAARIVTGEQDLVLSGERAKLAVLFSDIRGFTPLSQRVAPEEVVSLLSRYFGEMAEIVYGHDGTLDKFMGDGMMAFFGHPTAHEDDTLRAVKAALEMQRRMSRLQKEWESEGKEPLTIGIGISTGDVVVGDVGTKVRYEYTAIGAHVNLASRLESQAPGGAILLSETAYEEVRDRIEARPLDPIQVKGISEPVTVYELIGLRSNEENPESQEETNSTE
jgi:adenylate cyclase